MSNLFSFASCLSLLGLYRFTSKLIAKSETLTMSHLEIHDAEIKEVTMQKANTNEKVVIVRFSCSKFLIDN